MKLDREFRDFLIDLFKLQAIQFYIHLSAIDFLLKQFLFPPTTVNLDNCLTGNSHKTTFWKRNFHVRNWRQQISVLVHANIYLFSIFFLERFSWKLLPLLVEILSQDSGASFPIKADVVLISDNVAISHIWYDCLPVIRIQDIQYDCTDISDCRGHHHQAWNTGFKNSKAGVSRILSLNDVLMKWKFLKISCTLIPTTALSSNKWCSWFQSKMTAWLDFSEIWNLVHFAVNNIKALSSSSFLIFSIFSYLKSRGSCALSRRWAIILV